MNAEKIRVCFVCLGNICRSPTAEGVFLKLLAEENLLDRFEVDSAGTGDWHAGELADRRTREEAKKHGLALTSRARQVRLDDFEKFDYILAMDHANKSDLEHKAPLDEHLQKIYLFRDFGHESERGLDVPDPYYGGEDGFKEVFEICERACRGFLEHLKKNELEGNEIV